MKSEWNAVPDDSSYEYFTRLLCQGLQVESARKIVEELRCSTNKNDHSVDFIPFLYIYLAKAETLLRRWKNAYADLNVVEECLANYKSGDKMDTSKESRPSGNQFQSPCKSSSQCRTTGGKRAWKSNKGHDVQREQSNRSFRKHRMDELAIETNELREYLNYEKKRTGLNESIDRNKIFASVIKRVYTFHNSGTFHLVLLYCMIFSKLV